MLRSWQFIHILAVQAAFLHPRFEAVAEDLLGELKRSVLAALGRTPSGVKLAVCSGDYDGRGELALVDAVAGEPRALVRGVVVHCAWNPTGDLIATEVSGAVRLLDAGTGEMRRVWREAHDVRAMAWSCRGVLAVGSDQGLRLLDAHSGAVWPDPETDTCTAQWEAGRRMKKDGGWQRERGVSVEDHLAYSRKCCRPYDNS